MNIKLANDIVVIQIFVTLLCSRFLVKKCYVHWRYIFHISLNHICRFSIRSMTQFFSFDEFRDILDRVSVNI